MTAASVEPETPPGPQPFVRLGYVVAVGAGWFVVAIVLLHAFRSADYD